MQTRLIHKICLIVIKLHCEYYYHHDHCKMMYIAIIRIRYSGISFQVTILYNYTRSVLSFKLCIYYGIVFNGFLHFNIGMAITQWLWCWRWWLCSGVVNIGVDIKFIAEQRKHSNAIMSLLVRLISQTLWRNCV